MRQTLAREAVVAGLGLHTGRPCTLTLAPAPFGHGLVFYTSAGAVPATVDNARAEPGSTVLANGGATVHTPEHLLAALDALGVTDARLTLSDEELPAGDGSAAAFVDAIDQAGRVPGPPMPLRWWRTCRVEDQGGVGTTNPVDPSHLAVVVDFGVDGPRGALSVPRTEAAFRKEVAFARTFVLASDVAAFRAAGRGRGASSENTLVWPTGARRAPDEPVRHKLLDLWGDVALAGPMQGSVEAVRGSHRLHLALLRIATAPSPAVPS